MRPPVDALIARLSPRLLRGSACLKLVALLLVGVALGGVDMRGETQNPQDPNKKSLSIEQGMRAWQERLYVATGRKVAWHDRNGSPVDEFPADGTFPCDSYTDDELAELVRQIATAMTHVEEIQERSYVRADGKLTPFRYPDLARFILEPVNGDVAGLSGFPATAADEVFVRTPANFVIYGDPVGTFAHIDEIDKDNFHDSFAEICQVLGKLDTALFLYSGYTQLDGRNGSATGTDFAQVAANALSQYRLSTGGSFAPQPTWIFQGSKNKKDGSFSAMIASSKGYFSIDRTSTDAAARFQGHSEIPVYVWRIDLGPPFAPDSNNPSGVPSVFQLAGTSREGEDFKSAVFEPPAPDQISVAGMSPTGPGGNPSSTGWAIDCYVLIKGGWRYAVDSGDGLCECAACTANLCTEATAGTPQLGSVNFTISLGAEAERPLGRLQLYSEKPSLLLSRPQSLIRRVQGNVRSIVDYSAPLIAVDPEALSLARRPLQQLQATDWVAAVVDLGTAGYRLQFYHRAGLPAPALGTQLINVTGAHPFHTYLFENVGGDANDFRITDTDEGGMIHVYRYVYDATTETWTLTTGAGADERRESVVRRDDGLDWWETRSMRGLDDAVVSEESLHYHTFPWNDRADRYRGNHGELVERISDPLGEARTTSFTYYTDEGVDRGAYRKLRSVEHPDGSWERYIYDPHTGVLQRTVRPFGDAAPDAPESQCRVSSDLLGVLPDADGDGKPESIRTQTEFALGLEVSRSYHVVFSRTITAGSRLLTRALDVSCQTPGAAWDAADNLVTETRLYADGPDSGKVFSVLSPDGTMQFVSYARTDGRLATTTDSGEPSADHTSVIRGRRTVTVKHPLGSTQSMSVYDIESGLLLDRSETFDQDFDAFGRPLTVLHLDGTAEQFVYGCCGLDSYEDRAGTTENNIYDSLKRRTSTTRAGLTTITVYDAAGRVVTTQQRSRDNQVRTLSRSDYTPGGRLRASYDLLNRPTRFAEALDVSGHNVRTTTRADLSTQVETDQRDGRLLATSGSAVHPMAYEYAVVFDTHDGRTFNAQVTTAIRLGAGGERTEWTRTYADMLGRTYKVEAPSFSGAGTDVALSFFNSRGQLVRQRAPDGVTTLFVYDGQGRQSEIVLDANGNGTAENNGTDRITRTTQIALQDPVRGVLSRTATSVFLTLGDGTPTVVSETDTNPSTRTTWQRRWGRETESRTETPGNGEVRQITTGPDSVVSTSISVDGFATDQSVVNAAGESFGHQTFRYDVWGRQEATIDARNGEATTAYDAGDRVRSVTSPAPDAVQPRQTTTFGYDALDRATSVELPDAASQFRAYYATGETKREWGARQYPVDYTYDAQGRLSTMTTWQDYAGATGAATTTWHYSPSRGVLDRKTYQDNSHVDYTYTAAGRLSTRTWARGIVTTYGYDPLTADLVSVAYSDGTPGSSYTYDRAGRIAGKSDAVGVCSYGYTQDVMTNETHSSGLLAGMALARGQDLGRLSSLTVTSPNATIYQAGYSYRDAQNRDTGRLATVAFGTANIAYSYEANSQLLRDTIWSEGSTERVRATTLFDAMNRLVSRTTKDGAGQTIRSYAYGYNAANQRVAATLETGEAWRYGFDELGQVSSGAKKTAADQSIPGYDLGYTFDDIGNRTATQTNGRSAGYSVNLLNEYQQRDVPRAIDVLGEGLDGATMTVNGLATIRTAKTGADDYFYTPYPAEAAGSHNLTIRSGVAGTPDQVFDEQRKAYQSATPERFTHDADGNLTDDWRWHYTWDGENRLIAQETQPAAFAVGVPRQRLEFDYDYQGRRTAKRVFAWDSNAGLWTLSSDFRFLYDGWNLLAEFNLERGTSNLALVRSHLWGSDLSGSLQGAGGVGGLLLTQSSTTAAIPAYDGNGNVIGLVDMATGVKSATYDYNAFGETIQSEGVAALANPFRFSTKYTDDETGLLYYGYRFYQPSTGRWLSRDPIKERGGVNLYGMVRNDPVNQWDLLGMGIPGDPLSPDNPEIAVILGDDAANAAAQQLAREGEAILAREAAARAAAAVAAAAAAANAVSSDTKKCDVCTFKWLGYDTGGNPQHGEYIGRLSAELRGIYGNVEVTTPEGVTQRFDGGGPTPV